MSDSNSNSNSNNNQQEDAPAPSAKLPSPSIETAKLQIPEAVIPHLESALLKSAVGMTTGAVFGLVFFRGGKGWRMASIGAGLGVALGSSAERYWTRPDAPPRSIFKVDGLF